MSFSCVLLFVSGLIAFYTSWLSSREKSNNAHLAGVLAIGYFSIAADMHSMYGFRLGPIMIFCSTMALFVDSVNPENMPWNLLKKKLSNMRRDSSD